MKPRKVFLFDDECWGRELELLHATAYNQTAEQETHEADIWP